MAYPDPLASTDYLVNEAGRVWKDLSDPLAPPEFLGSQDLLDFKAEMDPLAGRAKMGREVALCVSCC